MAFSYKEIKYKFLELIPLFLLFFISLNGNSVIDFSFFSINVHYILIYYWVLKRPQALGYGFIFLSGLINDVVLSLPLGTSALCYLFVSLVAVYVGNATVRSSLFTDWFTFIIAILIGNFLYFFLMNKFAEVRVEYISVFYNSFFTFLFYPFFWVLFEFYRKFIIVRSND